MRLEIRYVTEFDYHATVRESHNELRACPAELPWQRLLRYDVAVEPACRIHTFTDHWGTRVDAFGIRHDHDLLRVVADATVEMGDWPGPPDEVPLEALDPAFSRRHAPFVHPSAHTQWDLTIAEAARDLAAGAGGAVDLAGRVMTGVHQTLDYVPGATYVGVSPGEVFAAGQGVCQDYAHLAIAMCRSLGMPARYVSGYFHAADQSVGLEPEEAEIEVQTHAWVEVAIPGFGWWALDPTNDQTVGSRHVKIGHGRDYDDTLPLRGVFHGPPEHDLGVKVLMTRDRLAAAGVGGGQQ